MVIEGKIPVEPENIEDLSDSIPNHRRVARKPKGNETLDVLCQMRGQGSPDALAGNLFVSQTMSRRKTQFAPRELAQPIEGISKGGLLPELACREAIFPPVKIAEGEQWWVLLGWLIGNIRGTKAWPLRRWRTSKALPSTHTRTWVLK